MSVKTMLWIDCLGGLLAGLFVTLKAEWLARLTGLPLLLVVRQGRISLSYALYSFSLTRRPQVSALWLKVLVGANFAYAAFCLALLLGYARVANPWGWFYLLLESGVVAALANWERRVFFATGPVS